MLLVVIFEHSFQELFKDPLVAAEKDLPSKSIAFHALAERTVDIPGLSYMTLAAYGRGFKFQPPAGTASKLHFNSLYY